MSKVVAIREEVKPVAEEYPALRAAYEAETAAVARIDELKRRLPQAQADVVLRRRDRDALASRTARGEAITVADLRQADEAIRDTEAMVALLSEALPATASEAKTASRARYAEEAKVISEKRQPFLSAVVEAEMALKTAQDAYDRALRNAGQMPSYAQAALDALLDGHGRDRVAANRVSEITRLEEVNRMRQGTNLPQVEAY